MLNNPAARLSIVAYRPKPGKDADLLALTLEHVPFLRSIGAATDRPHIITTAADGTIVEVFEWAEGGLAMAHQHPEVKALWTRYAEACDIVPLNTLKEAWRSVRKFRARQLTNVRIERPPEIAVPQWKRE